MKALSVLTLWLAMAPVPSARAATAIPTVLLPIPSSPLVTFRIQFGAGAVDDPTGQRGLTRLTASMLSQGGTRTYAYEEIVQRLYPMAASVTAYVDKEVTTFVGTTHVDNLDAYLGLLVQIIAEPRFDPRDFERIRTSQVNYLANSLRGSNDEELGKQSLGVLLYAGHPYGAPNEGWVSNLDAITLDDVKAHYARCFTIDNVTVGISGGYPPALVERVTRALQNLPAGRPARGTLATPSPILDVEVLAVEKDCMATAISIGYPIDVTRSDPDFYALLVANSHLGEHRTFNGRLMNRMREVRGLNYGDYSYIEHFVQDGGSTYPLTNLTRSQQYFSIWIRPVQHQHRHFALRLAIWELDRLVRGGMTQEELDETRTFLKNYSRLWAQDQSRRLGYLMDSRFYGIDDYLATLPAKLDALTLDQVNAAIKLHLQFNRLRVAIVTRGADEFLNDLITNQASPMTYDAEGIPEDVIAEDRAIAVYKLNVNRAASKIVDVEEMFK